MIILDLKKSCIKAEYRIWQQLFNFYRSHNCPLDVMDNMLIDLRNCEDALTLSYNKITRFLWAIDKREYHTAFAKVDQESWEFLEQYMSMYDFVVHVTINGDCVTFDVVKGSY